MIRLTDLPPELLSRIVRWAAIRDQSDDDFDNHCEEDGEFQIQDGPTYPGLSSQQSILAISPRPCLTSLRNLRLVSRTFSQLSTPLLFRVVRVVPSEESAARYTNILDSISLSCQVSKVVFQTRNNPDSGTIGWSMPEPGDEYTEPHEFFTQAMEQVGRFPNLTNVELVFATACDHDPQFMECPESTEFRIEILQAFFEGLNHEDHPAVQVTNLSIKNLQDRTPDVLIPVDEHDTEEDVDTEENIEFQTNFHQVMSRITQLSLQVATEYDSASPENTLKIPECHDFFGHELQTYWLAPMADKLTYLKLYATEMYIGWFPQCNLPVFPALRTLVLGNMSFVQDEQVDWVLSHSATLEELILDDCLIPVAVRMCEHEMDTSNGKVTYELDTSYRPSYRPKEGYDFGDQVWSNAMRWHHIFDRLKQMSHLKHFAIGHGNWNGNLAYDEADTLQSVLTGQRYMYFDEGTGPSPWLDSWGEDEDFLVSKPDCDAEDRDTLKVLLEGLKKRRT